MITSERSRDVCAGPIVGAPLAIVADDGAGPRAALKPGEVRKGVVFYRGVDAGYATQRDVSRSKRDIKTFEIRLRVDNRDRRLALGMTAYVLLPPRVQSGLRS